MGPLHLQHEVLIKHIGAGFPTGLINAGDRRAGHAMATRDVKHRPLLQHGVSSMGLTVDISGEHGSSFMLHCMPEVCTWRLAPFLPYEPCHNRRTVVPVLYVILPPPDLIALCRGRLLTHGERQAEGLPVDLPRALPELRDHDGLQRAIGTEMVRPVRLVREDVADDLR